MQPERPRHYVLGLDGAPVAVDEVLVWASWFETADRSVAQTQIGPLRVSTVFLGLDHQWGDGPPVLWETMVFADLEHSDHTRRYTSREAAVEGHAEVCVELQIEYALRDHEE